MYIERAENLLIGPGTDARPNHDLILLSNWHNRETSSSRTTSARKRVDRLLSYWYCEMWLQCGFVMNPEQRKTGNTFVRDPESIQCVDNKQLKKWLDSISE